MVAVGRILIQLGGALLAGCAVHDSGTMVPAVQHERSILAGATPSPGSTVRVPVDELKLQFAPPARLDEVTVNGPDGLMPTMVHAVAEVPDYSIPLPDLGPGAYTVSWRATAQGKVHRGGFGFTVK